MRGDVLLSTATLLGFILTLVRMGSVLVFVPLPGVTSIIHPARVILTLGITIALFSQWPQVTANPSVGLFTMWIIGEAALGIGIGLLVAFATEAFSVGAQIIGLQAGYAFASTIDPNTQADSSVLGILAQLTAGMLFFATGLDREVIRIFARSLETSPAGAFVFARGAGEQILSIGSTMFSTGFRLALPILAVLIMVDISLALLGRVNSQVQLLTIAFPAKMLIALAMLGWLAVTYPVLLRVTFGTALSAARGLISR
jgi:flagellar biosynthetic protein FliR